MHKIFLKNVGLQRIIALSEDGKIALVDPRYVPSGMRRTSYMSEWYDALRTEWGLMYAMTRQLQFHKANGFDSSGPMTYPDDGLSMRLTLVDAELLREARPALFDRDDETIMAVFVHMQRHDCLPDGEVRLTPSELATARLMWRRGITDPEKTAAARKAVEKEIADKEARRNPVQSEGDDHLMGT
jgi:hypothetical protein